MKFDYIMTPSDYVSRDIVQNNAYVSMNYGELRLFEVHCVESMSAKVKRKRKINRN